MRNRTNQDASIIWTLKADSAKTSPLFISNSTEVKFDLKPKAPHNKANMSFGMGTWTDGSLIDFVQDLESVVIKTATDSLILNNQQQIQNFLDLRRKGVGKRVIRIAVQ
jgi:hypothetical protein